MRNIKIIQLNKEPKLFNDTLIHWTGRNKTMPEAFNKLKKIIKTSSLLIRRHQTSKPTIEITKTFITKSEYYTSMICFTDIPIEQSILLCKKYGYFGIGFKKEVLIEYGANPVFYFTDSRNKTINSYKDSESIIEFDYNIELSWLGSMLQHIDTGKSQYYEREWRIIRTLPSRYFELNPTHFEQYEHECERLNGVVKPVLNKNNPEKDKFYLEFNKKDVACIIVPKEFYQEAQKLIEEHDIDCRLVLIET